MSLPPGKMIVPEEEWAGYLEWRGRAPDQSAGRDKILHLKNVAIPEWRFEWHPQERRLYLIRQGVLVDNARVEGGKVERGELIAYNVETYGQAYNALLVYLRGVAEGRTQSLAPNRSTTLVGV